MATATRTHRQIPSGRAVLLALSIFLSAACGGAGQDDRSTAMNEQRRAGVRDTLREKLGTEYDVPLPVATNAEIEQGAKIYDTLCRSCHGPTGQGDGRSSRSLSLPPASLVDPESRSFFSERAKLEIIADGTYGTPMVGWSEMLDEEERLAVLHFVNTLSEETAPEAP